MRSLLEFLETPITVMHAVVCVFLMMVVLIQPGKSGGIGAALGGAGAQQVFGGRGAGNFLTKVTWVCATIFFSTSVTLAYLSSSTNDSISEVQDTAAPANEGASEDEGSGETPAEDSPTNEEK